MNILAAFVLGALIVGIPGFFYVRIIERDGEKLRASLDALTVAYTRLSRKFVFPQTGPSHAENEQELPEAVAAQMKTHAAPRRFRSFGAEKQRLESQEPPQRSVNV